MKLSPAVIEALRKAQSDLRVQMAAQQDDAKLAHAVALAKDHVVEETRSKLEALAAFLKEHAEPEAAPAHDAEPPAVTPDAGTSSLTAPMPTLAATAVQARVVRGAALKRVVLEEALRLLSDGQWRPTEEIYASLRARGIELDVAHPVVRISQILSLQQRMFKNVRGLGWTLKGEDPVAAGSSGATELTGSQI